MEINNEIQYKLRLNEFKELDNELSKFANKNKKPGIKEKRKFEYLRYLDKMLSFYERNNGIEPHKKEQAIQEKLF